MTTGIRTTGEFCWFNLLTPRPAEARAFFASVLGWEYTEIPFMGHNVKVGTHTVGAIFDIDSGRTPAGTPPHIGVMIKTDSADATCGRVVALGGKTQPPFDIMGNLRMAVCTDPSGAGFDLWEAGKSRGTDVDTSLHGAPSWFELLTPDVRTAQSFYCELFDWTPEVMPMPGGEYTTFKHGATSVAGMLQIMPAMGEMRPHWGTYFTVRDAEEAVREAVRLGATMRVQLREVAGVGRFCGLLSPQGVTFHMMQYNG